MRGRKPTPAVLKLAGGNRGHRRINRNEPKADMKAPPQPTFLNAEEKYAWKYVTEKLKSLNLLASSDLVAILSYCHFFAQYTTAKKHLKASGEADVIETKTGRLVQNPWLKVVNEALRELNKVSSDLGLNAAARARMEVKTEAPQSMAAKLGLGLK